MACCLLLNTSLYGIFVSASGKEPLHPSMRIFSLCFWPTWTCAWLYRGVFLWPLQNSQALTWCMCLLALTLAMKIYTWCRKIYVVFILKITYWNNHVFSIFETGLFIFIVVTAILEALIYQKKRTVFSFDVEQPTIGQNQYNCIQMNKLLNIKFALAMSLPVAAVVVVVFFSNYDNYEQILPDYKTLMVIHNCCTLTIPFCVIFPIFTVIENPDILQFCYHSFRNQ